MRKGRAVRREVGGEQNWHEVARISTNYLEGIPRAREHPSAWNEKPVDRAGVGFRRQADKGKQRQGTTRRGIEAGHRATGWIVGHCPVRAFGESNRGRQTVCPNRGRHAKK